MTTTGTLNPETIRDFVIAAHFNLDKVQHMLNDQPSLRDARHQWGENDYEDALGAASHVGNRRIAEFILAKGASLTIFAAAMLGRTSDVLTFLQGDRSLANARGPHHIPIMFHAALSGNTEITNLLHSHGCREGYNSAIHAAIMVGHTNMVQWLLDHGATDLQNLNHEGKTPLKKAIELGQAAVIEILKSRGAVE